MIEFAGELQMTASKTIDSASIVMIRLYVSPDFDLDMSRLYLKVTMVDEHFADMDAATTLQQSEVLTKTLSMRAPGEIYLVDTSEPSVHIESSHRRRRVKVELKFHDLPEAFVTNAPALSFCV